MMRRPAWQTAPIAALLCATTAHAQNQSEQTPQALSFDAALARIDDASPGLSGEDHAVRASELIAGATRSLNRPVITTSASVIE